MLIYINYYNLIMFIVLDGIDGAGKGRQREEVLKTISENDYVNIKGEEFPVHNAFYETVIHPALQGDATMNKASWVLSYLLDKTLAADKIKPFVKDPNNLFIADGYFTTTIAYQSYLMNQVEVDNLLQYAEDFEIPKPDFAIYLDVDPEIAFKRKELEEGHEEGLDMFEKSLEKQKKLRTIFKKMVKDNIYCNWTEIDGNGSVEEVRGAILSIIRSKKLL